MTRRLVYGGGLLAFADSGNHIHYTYGLHRRCSSLTHTCSPFPQPVDCAHDRYFCSMWRSVGFLMSFAVVMEGMTTIAYIVIMAGGKQKRESGWKVLTVLHAVVAVLLGASLSIIAYLYDHDDRFFPGWRLDTSWVLCTVSFAAVFLIGAGLLSTALLLPSEAGYELIPNYADEEE
ncbi:MAG: hypothetical protein OHK93_000335 [Ramalina farinacea]|uniref:Uncharacterized protein n=1 Tax=Ramalina farinacea TaxID=258253 RepID=A0AA43QI90_9LECA|nr:hypothetical protein [Ramalina farinacea]